MIGCRETMTRNWRIRCLLAAAALAFAGSGCNGASRSDPLPDEPAPADPAADASDLAAAPIDPAAAHADPTPATGERTEPLAIENAAYADAAEYSAHHGGLALVVIEADRVALAIGQNGHRVDEAHPLHGASESFWGPVAVAAEHAALLDLDEPVAVTIDEWEGVRWKNDMRVRQLLQYTSGLESGVWPLLQENPANHYERALTLEMVAAPGERFQVGPSHLAVFGEVLRRKLAPERSDALAYLERQILGPIGLKIASWQRDAAGNLDLANGARMTASEWAKFGVLIRDQGHWNGESVLDAEGIEACLRRGKVQPRFGLTFWLNARQSGAARSRGSSAGQAAISHEGLDDLVMAAGAGNQRLYVIPSLNLVVARFGEDDRDWRDPDFLALIAAAAASDS
jgi:CubicO group peptidase (beta-lactamase class C family)